MQVELQAHIAFHLTGRMPQGEGDALARSDLQPALLAGYRDLTALRYDFPLVLVGKGGDGQSVQSLSALFDGALKEIAANGDGERIRKHAGRLEREIRKLIAEGTTGTLFKLCDLAAARIGAKNDESVAEKPEPSARRAQERRRGHRLRQGDAVPAVSACLAGLAGPEGAEIPRRDQQADHETVRHPERGFRPLEGRDERGKAASLDRLGASRHFRFRRDVPHADRGLGQCADAGKPPPAGARAARDAAGRNASFRRRPKATNGSASPSRILSCSKLAPTRSRPTASGCRR